MCNVHQIKSMVKYTHEIYLNSFKESILQFKSKTNQLYQRSFAHEVFDPKQYASFDKYNDIPDEYEDIKTIVVLWNSTQSDGAQYCKFILIHIISLYKQLRKILWNLRNKCELNAYGRIKFFVEYLIKHDNTVYELTIYLYAKT